MKFLISTCCALVLTGCASQYNYQAPEVSDIAQEQYAYHAFTPDQWLSFGSPDLARLLEQAFAHNWDLKIAAERLTSAQLALDLERANQGISASGSLSASQSTSTDDSWNYQSSEGLSFSARYEWDLWGKLQAQEDQAALSTQVSQWDLEAAQISLTANIIRLYFSYLATKERLAIAAKNLASARESLELYTLQHDAGVVSKSDLLRQQSTILSLEERTETLSLQQADQARAIALLSGIDQWIEYAPDTLLSDINVPQVALNQPAQLVRHRPDLKAAEASVRQAFLNKTITELDRWPNLSISLSLRPSDLYNLAEQWALSLSESIGMTLYDGGARTLNEQRAAINETIARVDYQRTVRTALEEVKDNLSSYQQSLIGYRYQLASYDNLTQQTDIIEYEWQEGVSDKSDLISAQRSLYSAEESLVSNKLTVLQAITALYQVNGSVPRM